MKKVLFFMLVIGAIDGCIEPANIEVPPFTYQLVVDGFITTDPGPYTVKLYRSRPLGASVKLDRLIAEKFAKITMKDDVGNSELLTETAEGVYQTALNGMRGQTGRSYHIDITLINGLTYESVPEMIRPVGEVTDIQYEFVAGNGAGFREGDGFKIFADATGVPNHDDYVRLRMVATYKVETFPQLRTKRVEGGDIPDPYPCSGYVRNQDNRLVKVGDCECCICWPNLYDEIPSITNEQFTTNDIFRGEYVGFVPATRQTLYEKIRIEIQEMSLTPETYLFWKLVKAQKEGLSNIFQPPSAKLKSNIKALNSEQEVLGIFWAAGIKSKSIYIDRLEVPYIPQPIDTLKAPCTFIPNSTNKLPSFWQ
ncbi:MAG: DUF4249 domain-containing protein [Cyclobacteriaceae bacterium]|nr:DUF4249 domain-containing protein [Cyclobacteriaceae bacterium]